MLADRCVKILASLPAGQVIFLGAGALAGAVIYALGWILGWPRQRDLLDFALWCVAGSVYGALVAFGFYLYLHVPDVARDVPPTEVRSLIRILNSPVIYLIIGVPYILIVAMGRRHGLRRAHQLSEAIQRRAGMARPRWRLAAGDGRWLECR